jgi:methionyl-tRNA formyltransferase
VRIVFLGSGSFAAPSFEALLEAGHDVAALVTQPDRESGRGRRLRPPPMKAIAQSREVPVLQPRRIRDPAAVAALRGLLPDIQVVAAYGQILPRAVLEIPSHGTVNVHGSLLPRHRGAAPVQWAIANGEPETGVTVMLLDEGLDTGPTFLRMATTIEPAETAPELEARLARLGARALLETLEGIERGTLTPVPQDDAAATLAPLLRKEDGLLRWTRTAVEIERRIRAFQPWPGSQASISGRLLKVLRAHVMADRASAGPGTVLAIEPGGVVVACGAQTALRLVEVQPESRRAMPAAAFAAGARLSPGARFD